MNASYGAVERVFLLPVLAVAWIGTNLVMCLCNVVQRSSGGDNDSDKKEKIADVDGPAMAQQLEAARIKFGADSEEYCQLLREVSEKSGASVIGKTKVVPKASNDDY